jgi:hypothetical protein
VVVGLPGAAVDEHVVEVAAVVLLTQETATVQLSRAV